MSVLLDTSVGELVIDLFTNECPLACENFLKLCKIKFYNGCLVFNVQQNYICQTGDPTGTGKGGSSIFGILHNDQNIGFVDEIINKRKLNKVGLVCMANHSENSNKSQFFVTLRDNDLKHLQGRHTVFGEVAEGFDILEKINSLYCDEDGRPYQDVRIKHTFILDDPYPDPHTLQIPPESPEWTIPTAEKVKARIPYSENLDMDENLGKTEEEIDLSIKRKEAYSRALVLEMTGDIPDVEAKPPAEVLFVCKLNPVTTDADLELIFSRFGQINECAIIRDAKTGDSLNYAFIEFESEDSCIEAYEKMNNVLIDDRRIKVDFSQSVSKLWNKYLLRPRKDTKKERLTQTAKDITMTRNHIIPESTLPNDVQKKIYKNNQHSSTNKEIPPRKLGYHQETRVGLEASASADHYSRHKRDRESSRGSDSIGNGRSDYQERDSSVSVHSQNDHNHGPIDNPHTQPRYRQDDHSRRMSSGGKASPSDQERDYYERAGSARSKLEERWETDKMRRIETERVKDRDKVRDNYRDRDVDKDKVEDRDKVRHNDRDRRVDTDWVKDMDKVRDNDRGRRMDTIVAKEWEDGNRRRDYNDKGGYRN